MSWGWTHCIYDCIGSEKQYQTHSCYKTIVLRPVANKSATCYHPEFVSAFRNIAPYCHCDKCTHWTSPTPFPSVLSHFFRLTGEWQLVHKPTATSSGAGISAPLQWWSCSDSSFIMENYFKQRKTAEPHFFPHVSATITPAIDKMSKFIAE